MAVQYQLAGVPVASGDTRKKEPLCECLVCPGRMAPKRGLEAVRERGKGGGVPEAEFRRAATQFNAD